MYQKIKTNSKEIEIFGKNLKIDLDNFKLDSLENIFDFQEYVNQRCNIFLKEYLNDTLSDKKIILNFPFEEEITPFDSNFLSLELTEGDLDDNIIILYYNKETIYIVRELYKEEAIKLINNEPVLIKTLYSIKTLYNYLNNKETQERITYEQFDQIIKLIHIENSNSFDFILSLEDYNKILNTEIEVENFELTQEELIPETIKEYNNGIFICEIPNSSEKVVYTEFNYNKNKLGYIIIEDVTNGNLKDWTERHKDSLNENSDLRDKLVTNYLTYNEFLILEGISKKEEAYPLSQSLEEKPEKPSFNLTPHQQEKFDGLIKKIDEILVLQSSISRPPIPAYFMATLEGAAGTGKTTMMKKVLEELINKDKKIVFCSPTHQALGVIRNTLLETDLNFTEINDEFLLEDSPLIIKTLASFLGIKMKRDLENGKESFEQDPRAPQLCCDILCIDESSMISKDQLKIIIQKLHINVKCILFIGDEVQLDSPADNNESNGIFNLPQKYSLEEVVRQAADNKILQFAWELRDYIKTKNCNIQPSNLLHFGRINENILIFNDQSSFLNHYFNNESSDKLVSTYTNKITDEYNSYIRQMKLLGQGGYPLNIIIDKDEPDRKIIKSWEEYKEFYPGEELVSTEPNQRNTEVIHQTGEKFIIKDLKEETYSISITEQDPIDMLATSQVRDFTIKYFEIIDTNNKIINVIRAEDQELYNEILQLLSLEAKKSLGKHPWAKYWRFKEKFTKVNKTFAFTLHKLQGSTCEHIYIDARDLDKFFKRMPIGVYKLIYIALTRPKQTVAFLI